jgi:HSP20 family protein
MFLVPVSRHSRPLSHLLDHSFDHFFGAVPASTSPKLRSPALDVAETEAAYTVKLDMPGVAKEDVKVSVEGRQVTVQAHKPAAEATKEGERLVYRERALVRYARSFTLPAEVDPAQTLAKLAHGVLELTLPKLGARRAAHISVN